jgi:hypothetical protein
LFGESASASPQLSNHRLKEALRVRKAPAARLSLAPLTSHFWQLPEEIVWHHDAAI